jgi:hypothetical protein
MEENTQRFIDLFAGLDRAFGKYILDDGIIVTDGEKAKGRGVTVREDLMPEHYTAHLNGEHMLGVIPIKDGNFVRFSAIDIDDYSLDIPELLVRINNMKLPLVPTRSKSGGLHLWMFFSIDVPAKSAQQKLAEIGSALGFPGVEVFPKQHHIAPTDVGNWINLPWYEAEQTDRYGWTLEGEEIRDLGEWLDYAEARRITLKDLNRITISEPAEGIAERPFSDGPPCLQTLCERGVPEGMRNQVMFAVGVYSRAKHPDDNRDQIQHMHAVNNEFFDPRMSDKELNQVHNNVDDSEYRYTCAQEPLASNCNRTICLQRRHGCRLNGTNFNYGTLWQHVPVTDEGEELYDEAHWRLQVNYNERQYMLDHLAFEDLMSFRAIYQKAGNRRLVLPPPEDANAWRNQMEAKIEHCEVVHEPEEASDIGELRSMVSDFLNMVGSGTDTKIEVRHGKAWLDEDEDAYWFQSDTFMQYLKAQRYAKYGGTRLTTVLRDRFGFRTGLRRRVGGHSTRIWTCPSKLRLTAGTDAPEADVGF